MESYKFQVGDKVLYRLGPDNNFSGPIGIVTDASANYYSILWNGQADSINRYSEHHLMPVQTGIDKLGEIL